jgi:kynurenine formamidase
VGAYDSLNYPHLSSQAIDYLTMYGFTCLIINLPSFDDPKNDKQPNSEGFLSNPYSLLINCVDTNDLTPGLYITNIGIYPTDND